MYLKALYSHTKNLGMVAGLVAALCFSNIALASGTWYIQESGITKPLRDVCFIDSLNGWSCGGKFIIHTSNGGDTWECQLDSLAGCYMTIEFIDSLKGWVGGGCDCGMTGCDAVMRRTVDGGYTWNGSTTCKKGRPPYLQWIKDIDFPDPFHGFYVYFEETPGGLWLPFSRIYQLPITHWLLEWDCIEISKICFSDSLHGWVAATFRHRLELVFSVRITGSSMEVPVERFFTTILNDLDFVDTLQGWTVGEEGTILHTTNGGFTWASQISGIANTFYAVDFVDSLNGWVVGAGGSILRTRNGGDSWIIEPSPTNADLYALCFADTNNGWAVGDDGTILCYTTGAVCVAETKAESSPNCGLFNIYPNPFNRKTKIQFTLNKELSMTLKIYNTSGRLIETLINREIGTGPQSIEWNAKDVPSGVYFCKLKADDYTQTRKMILMK